jgi:hypothetical protein
LTTTVSAIDLPPEEAIAFLRRKVNATSKDWTTIWQRANVKSFTVAGAAKDALVDDFRQSVAKALETGTSLSTFMDDFDAIVARHGWVHNGDAAWRSRVIFETNLSVAYSAGRYAQQIEPETLAAFPYWQYVHSGARHPRHDHLSWDGQVLRADDPWWDTHYPPNGWGCGCWVRPVSARDLARQGKDGPDKAPPIRYRDWTNRKTGEVHQVPQGIDPGWDYNPGKEWKGEASVPATATTRPRPIVRPTEFKDLAQADDTLAADAAAWAESLSRPEMRALQRYKGSDGFLINEELRAGVISDGFASDIDALSAALDRALLQRPIRLYRGEGGRTPNVAAQIGDIITDRGFVSGSVDEAMASEMGAEGVVLEIDLPTGYPAAYVNRIPRPSAVPEYEVLLPRGRRFRVIDRDGNRLRLEAIDE